MWDEGASIQEIAAKCDVSTRTTYRDLDAFGIKPKSPLNVKPPVITQDIEKLTLEGGTLTKASGNLPIPIEQIPNVLIVNAIVLAEAWLDRAGQSDTAASVYLKVADHLARLAGAYAPEKRIQGNFKLEPPKPVAIPADVIEATGEIIKELNIDSDNQT